MKNKQGKIAIFQISLLLISMFAFAFLIGGMSKVSAADDVISTGETCVVTYDYSTVHYGVCAKNAIDCGLSLTYADNQNNIKGCSNNEVCCYNPYDYEMIDYQGKSCSSGELNGFCIHGGECDEGLSIGSGCTGTNVCCISDADEKTSPNGEDNVDLQTVSSYATTALGVKNTADQLKGSLEDGPPKNSEDTKDISSVQSPTSAKGSDKFEFDSADDMSGLVGSALGKLGISTAPKTAEYVITESGKKIFVSDLTTETLSQEAIIETVGASSGIGYSLAGIIKGATWGSLVNLGITWLGGELDPDNADLWDDVGTSVGWGIFAGQTAISLFGTGGALEGVLGLAALGPWGAVGIGAATAVIVFLSIYDETRTETVTFSCYPWAAPTGGENCELCNEQGDLPCTEYQCKSLGQACELINEQETGEPICYWKDPKDVTPPIMVPLEEALLADFAYTPDNAISPPDKGVKVVYDNNQDGCLPAFTPVAFGVNTSEPSRCKLDIARKPDFESMMSYMGNDASFAFEHTQTIVLPGPDATGNLTLRNGGKNSLYVRCQDPNGNYDQANFVFNYCVNDGPDTTPPLIVTTSLLNGGPIAFNQSSVDLTTYVNEPADCRWDYLNRDYDEMENEMDCVSNPTQFNAQMLYECETTLSGLQSAKENKFYFRCEDQPLLEGTEDESDRNQNMESYEFVLQGTLPLQINSIEPNGTIDGPTDKIKVTLEVETAAGYKEGISICGYKEADEFGTHTDFFETNSYVHKQDLWLEEGSYNYSIMCVDLGGNVDYGNAVFDVETDLASPIVVRAYYEEGYMKLITSEEAMCVYGTDDCNYAFVDGIEIQSSQNVNHFVEWNTEEDLYIKCQDSYENQPVPQKECSIVVRASQYYEAEE